MYGSFCFTRVVLVQKYRFEVRAPRYLKSRPLYETYMHTTAIKRPLIQYKYSLSKLVMLLWRWWVRQSEGNAFWENCCLLKSVSSHWHGHIFFTTLDGELKMGAHHHVSYDTFFFLRLLLDMWSNRQRRKKDAGYLNLSNHNRKKFTALPHHHYPPLL